MLLLTVVAQIGQLVRREQSANILEIVLNNQEKVCWNNEDFVIKDCN